MVKFLPALGFHRDNAKVQSIIVLQRPEKLIGGQTVIAWPNAPYEDVRGKYASADLQFAKQWPIHVELNQLYVFDGTYAMHGTNDFDLSSAAKAQTPYYRDILSMAISGFSN